MEGGRQKREYSTTISLTHDDREKLKRLAAAMDRSMSGVIRQLIREAPTHKFTIVNKGE